MLKQLNNCVVYVVFSRFFDWNLCACPYWLLVATSDIKFGTFRQNRNETSGQQFVRKQIVFNSAQNTSYTH